MAASALPATPPAPTPILAAPQALSACQTRSVTPSAPSQTSNVGLDAARADLPVTPPPLSVRGMVVTVPMTRATAAVAPAAVAPAAPSRSRDLLPPPIAVVHLVPLADQAFRQASQLAMEAPTPVPGSLLEWEWLE